MVLSSFCFVITYNGVLFAEIPSLQKTLVHRTFLQELVFWTAKFEFPQKIVCLLLNLLPDAEYKVSMIPKFSHNCMTLCQKHSNNFDHNFLYDFRKLLLEPLSYITAEYPNSSSNHRTRICFQTEWYMLVCNCSPMRNSPFE